MDLNISTYISYNFSLNKYKSEIIFHYILYILKTVFKLKYVEAGLIASLQLCKIWILRQIFTTAEPYRNLQSSTLVGTQILKKLLPFKILLEKTVCKETVRIYVSIF